MTEQIPSRLSALRLTLDVVFILVVAALIWRAAPIHSISGTPGAAFELVDSGLPVRGVQLERRTGEPARLTVLPFRVESADGGQPLRDESATASLAIDGGDPILVPAENLPLTAGEHRLVLSGDDLLTEEVVARVEPGRDILLRVNMFPAESRGIANRVVYIADKRRGANASNTLQTVFWALLGLHVVAAVIYRLATRRMPYFSLIAMIGVAAALAWYARAFANSGLDGTITRSRTFWTFIAAAVLVGLYALDALRAAVPTFEDDR